MRFRADIARNALQVFLGQRTNSQFFGLAYPGDLQFHADFRVFFLVREPWARVLVRAVLRAAGFFLAGGFASFLAAACFFAAGFFARSDGLSLRADFHSRSRS